jgi:hypothetical protein
VTAGEVRRACLAALLLVSGFGCAPALFIPPGGPGIPAPDGDAIWRRVMSRCDAISGVRAVLAVSGRAGDRSIPGLAGARLATAVTSAGNMALEVYVSGQMALRLAGTAGTATLLLRDGPRVVSAGAADIVHAMIGLDINPVVWLEALSGCVAHGGTIASTRRYGDLLAVSTTDGARVFLQARGGAWQIRAARVGALAFDYTRLSSDLPQAMTIHTDRVRIALRVEELAINPALDPAVFTMRVPDDATAMSIEELRAQGPLGR